MSESIPCPSCGGRQSKVIDSRPVGNTTTRRRTCLGCKFRYSTVEVYKVSGVHSKVHETHDACVAAEAAAQTTEAAHKLCQRVLRLLLNNP